MSATATHISWIATTSTGRTVAEHEDYKILEGERKPWVRFLRELAPGEYLTSLRVQLNGQNVHLPRYRQTLADKPGLAPSHYSLEYAVEVDNVFGDSSQKTFLDIGAYYGQTSIHAVCELEGNNAWVEVRQDYAPHPDGTSPPRAETP